jgi:hypothetical protein
LSRHEARHCRGSSAIGLKQKGNLDMPHLSNGTVATDIDAHDDNAALRANRYMILHIETYRRDSDMSCIVWDAPEIVEGDLPFRPVQRQGPADTGRPLSHYPGSPARRPMNAITTTEPNTPSLTVCSRAETSKKYPAAASNFWPHKS